MVYLKYNHKNKIYLLFIIFNTLLIINEFDMSKYFPKNEYIHGTDFNTARKLYLEEMEKVN